jgi:vacuolar-type H+-ATPase subunit F/Vma7
MAFLIAGVISYNLFISTTSNIYSMIKVISDYEMIDVKNVLDKLDIECKLDIIEKVLYQQIEKECDNFSQNQSSDSMVIIPSKNIFKNDTNPIGRCLYYLCEAIEWIHYDLVNLHTKINKHNLSWISYITSPNVHAELKTLESHVKVLESRFDIYFKTLHIK